jgi:DNA-binding response OmpR family regulator
VTRILVVEDDPSIRLGLEDTLTAKGYQVDAVGRGGEGADKAIGGRYDLVVLDVMLPDLDGFEVCRRIRASRGASRRVPVIMLSARGAELDRVRGLELGADDYVTKPFSPRELVARVRAVLRRGGGEELADLLLLGDLEIDVPAREVRLRGKEVRLAAREFELLAFLARHPRRVFTREQLMQSVWGYTAAIDTGTLSVHVRRLREKIEDDPRVPRRIETVWNVGYRFVA